MLLDPAGEIVVIGLGTKVPAQVTFEGLAALLACREAYAIAVDDLGADNLRSSLQSLLDPLRTVPKIKSLSFAYAADRNRKQNYEDAAQVVLESFKEGSSVALLAPGHPLVFDSVCQNVVDICNQRGLSVRVIPGISFVSSILAELKMDFAPGIQIVDATYAYCKGISIDPHLDCLLVQTSVLGIQTPNAANDRLDSAWDSLIEYLTRIYPASHIVTAILIGDSDARETRRYSCELEKLRSSLDLMPYGSSLYLPSVRF